MQAQDKISRQIECIPFSCQLEVVDQLIEAHTRSRYASHYSQHSGVQQNSYGAVQVAAAVKQQQNYYLKQNRPQYQKYGLDKQQYGHVGYSYNVHENHNGYAESRDDGLKRNNGMLHMSNNMSNMSNSMSNNMSNNMPNNGMGSVGNYSGSLSGQSMLGSTMRNNMGYQMGQSMNNSVGSLGSTMGFQNSQEPQTLSNSTNHSAFMNSGSFLDSPMQQLTSYMNHLMDNSSAKSHTNSPSTFSMHSRYSESNRDLPPIMLLSNSLNGAESFKSSAFSQSPSLVPTSGWSQAPTQTQSRSSIWVSPSMMPSSNNLEGSDNYGISFGNGV